MLSLYNAALFPIRTVAGLWAFWATRRDPTRQREWDERLARIVPQVRPGGVWIHGAFLGEAGIVRQLAAEIRGLNPSIPLLLSGFTVAGRLGLPKPPDVDATFFFPLDFPWGIRRVLGALAPRAVVIVETELWPNLLQQARERGIPIASTRAWYDVPNVLAVAATSSTDALAYFSSYGLTTVDLGAPGVDTLSTVPTGDPCCSDPSGYKTLSGTSMATPHVAGAAALLLAQAPSSSALGIKSLLMGTVDPLAALAGKTVTGGRLNIHGAMSCSPTQMAVSMVPAANFLLDKDQPEMVAALVHSCGTPVLGAQVEAVFSNGEE